MQVLTDYQKEYIKDIHSILFYKTNAILTLGNWGATDFAMTIYKEMPALRFKVRGGKLKGIVNVCYNEGRDTFEVVTMKVQRKKNVYGFFDSSLVELEHIDNVYSDNLMRVIDSRVCDIY